MTRRLAALLLAIVAVGGSGLSGAAVPEVRAATPDLTIVTNAHYEVQPDASRVRVTLDMVLTNRLQDTPTKRFYFDHAFLSVLPEASGVKLSWSGSGTPRAVISKRTATYALVRMDLAQRLYSGRSAAYQLVFDLVDKGGAAAREVRVGSSLVSFPVWAYATDDTPGSTVRVVFPAGYRVDVASGDIPPPTTDAAGQTIFQTGKLIKPLTFFAYLVADRPGVYSEKTQRTTVGSVPVDLTIRAWMDDAPWSDRVGGLVARALPLLSERIGLPWPRDGGLVVHEVVSRSTGGYAGLFDPAAGQVEVAYDAGDDVVLHEAAHAWFNGALLADRWANEAFASFYGVDVGTTLKVKANAAGLTPKLETARIPLNAWGAVGTEDTSTEDYAYAASLELARAISERTGPEGLRAVWADAAGRVGAYQPPTVGSDPTSSVGGAASPRETVDGAPDWRGLLDLLDAHSTTSSDDLWRTWVARERDLALLDARKAARTRYDGVLADAGDWQMPRAVRDAMRAWRFDDANSLLDDAVTILDQRDTIATAAAASGLTVPDTLRSAYESPDGFASATLEATAELDVISRYDAAVAARLAASNVIQEIGLLGSTPDGDLELARTSFATGDLTKAAAAARSADAAWTSAEDVGRARLLSVAALALMTLVAIALFAVWLRRRRRRSAAAPTLAAEPGASSGFVGPETYATLAATPDPGEGPEVEATGARGAEAD